jgi:hypothetical protein
MDEQKQKLRVFRERENVPDDDNDGKKIERKEEQI